MKEQKISKIWVRTEKEEVIPNKFEELLLLSLCRVFIDEENKKEVEPIVCLTTQDEGGNEREFYFDFDQLSAFIDQLSAMRIDLMKQTARVFEKQLHKSDNRPIKGNNVIEMLDNLLKEFREEAASNDSRRKRKN